MSIDKYRPSLTSDQIKHIMLLCKKELTVHSRSVLLVLAAYIAKVEMKAVKPAFSIHNHSTLMGSLGLDEYEGLGVAEKEQKAYDKWINDPNSCNAIDLDYVQSYRSFNGLMTREEKEAYWKEECKRLGLEV